MAAVIYAAALTAPSYFAIGCAVATTEAEKLAERAAARERNTASLREWAERFGDGATTFLQKRTGLTFAAIARIIKGRAQPSPRTATLIENATGGAVRAVDLLGITAPTVATKSENASPDHAENAA